MSTQDILKNATDKMEKAVSQLHKEFASVRSGRANPLILDKVVVDYYGAPTPLRQMSQVTVQDGTTLVISPYDKSIIKDIEKAIIKAEIGITPNSDGICIRLPFPPLTEERRKETAKEVKKMGEDSKVVIDSIFLFQCLIIRFLCCRYSVNIGKYISENVNVVLCKFISTLKLLYAVLYVEAVIA